MDFGSGWWSMDVDDGSRICNPSLEESEDDPELGITIAEGGSVVDDSRRSDDEDSLFRWSRISRWIGGSLDKGVAWLVGWAWPAVSGETGLGCDSVGVGGGEGGVIFRSGGGDREVDLSTTWCPAPFPLPSLAVSLAAARGESGTASRSLLFPPFSSSSPNFEPRPSVSSSWSDKSDKRDVLDFRGSPDVGTRMMLGGAMAFAEAEKEMRCGPGRSSGGASSSLLLWEIAVSQSRYWYKSKFIERLIQPWSECEWMDLYSLPDIVCNKNLKDWTGFKGRGEGCRFAVILLL